MGKVYRARDPKATSGAVPKTLWDQPVRPGSIARGDSPGGVPKTGWCLLGHRSVGRYSRLQLLEPVTQLGKADSQHPLAASIAKRRYRVAMPCLCQAQHPLEFRMGTKAIEPRIAGKARKTVESPRDHAVEQRERPLNVTDVHAEACQIEESFRNMEVRSNSLSARRPYSPRCQ